MFSKSAAPSFMKNTTRRQETASTTASEGAKRLGSFGTAMTEKKKKPDDAVSRIQKYSSDQQERDKKAAAEKKKKPVASVAPSKGFFGRMVDKYYHGKTDDQ